MVSKRNLPLKVGDGVVPDHTHVHLFPRSTNVSSSSVEEVQSIRLPKSFSYRRIALETPSTTTTVNESSIWTQTPIGITEKVINIKIKRVSEERSRSRSGKKKSKKSKT